jgi:hypothetical protein
MPAMGRAGLRGTVSAGRHFDREPGERYAARQFGLLHQDAGNVGDAARGEIRSTVH